MNDEPNVSYYAIIPANVRYDSNVCPNAKLLYGEITALCNLKGFCWANNSYFANLYGVSKTSISKWVKQLIDGGYINSHIEYKLDTKEILNRYLTIITHPIEEKLNTPIEEKLKDNTTILNTKINNTFNNKKESIFLNYTTNNDLIVALNDFVLMRKKIKAPMTEKAIRLMLSRLEAISSSDEEKIAILNQSIMNSWKGIFELKDNSSRGRKQGFTQEGHKVNDYSNEINF